MSAAREVIVVGGGLAGSSAGCRAQELGAQVTLVDAADDPTAGGNTVLATGGMHIGPRRDPEVDDLEAIRASIMASTAGEARPELVDAYAGNARRALRWLVDAGVELVPRRPDTEYPRLAPVRDLNNFHDWHEKGSHRSLGVLQSRLESLGGEVVGSTRAVELLFGAQGRIAGVATEGGRRIPGDVVVLADGGFHADIELTRRHITPLADRLFPRGHPSGRGDALRMAVSAGAGLAGMDRFYGHCLHADAFINDRLWPWPGLDEVMTDGGVLVDRTGRRIVDESLGGVAVANEVAHAPEPCGWVVISAEVWRALEGRQVSGHLASNPELERRGATICRADTADALATELGIDGRALQATLEEYNDAACAGVAAALRVPRTGVSLPLNGPLLAMPLVPGISHTVGGMLIDGQARVLDADGRPIPGLFGAGATAAGIFEGPRSGYVGGLMVAVITGLLAGEGAAGA